MHTADLFAFQPPQGIADHHRHVFTPICRFLPQKPKRLIVQAEPYSVWFTHFGTHMLNIITHKTNKVNRSRNFFYFSRG